MLESFFFFLTKLIKLAIFFFSTVVRAVVVAKLITLGVSPLTSFVLALRVVSAAKLVISGISSLIFLILSLYTSL